MFVVWATYVLLQRPKLSAVCDWLTWVPSDQSLASDNRQKYKCRSNTKYCVKQSNMAYMSGHNPPEHIPAVWWPHDTAHRPDTTIIHHLFLSDGKISRLLQPSVLIRRNLICIICINTPCISYLRVDMCGTRLWPGVWCKCLSPGCMNARCSARRCGLEMDIARTRWGEVQVPGSKFLWYVSRDVWCFRENNIYIRISTQCSVLKWDHLESRSMFIIVKLFWGCGQPQDAIIYPEDDGECWKLLRASEHD